MADGIPKIPPAPQKPNPALQSSKSGQPTVARFFTTRNLSVVIVGAVLIIAMFRADSKDIPAIVQTLVDSRSTAIIGWAIAAIVLLGSIVVIRLLSHVYENEIERICKERDKLQNKLLGGEPNREE